MASPAFHWHHSSCLCRPVHDLLWPEPCVYSSLVISISCEVWKQLYMWSSSHFGPSFFLYICSSCWLDEQQRTSCTCGPAAILGLPFSFTYAPAVGWTNSNERLLQAPSSEKYLESNSRPCEHWTSARSQSHLRHRGYLVRYQLRHSFFI